MTDLLAPDLLATFDALFAEAEAAGEPDPTAMTLASADAGGRPAARTVLLKAHDARGFVLYTHLDGRKGRELQANPQAALLFHWPRVRDGVQVRIEGEVEIVADDEADAYFASRPRGRSGRGRRCSRKRWHRATPSRRASPASSRSSRGARSRARRAGAASG
jgi:pyridoxamine 5'-phosphate oxidase